MNHYGLWFEVLRGFFLPQKHKATETRRFFASEEVTW